MGVTNGSTVVARQPDLHLVVCLEPPLRIASPWAGTDLTSLQNDEDAVYEQDILRDLGSTKPWLAYIEFKVQHGTIHEQAFVMERACIQLPRSYKLWKLVRRTPFPRSLSFRSLVVEGY